LASTPASPARRLRLDKPAVFVLCALPLAWLTARAFGVGGLSLGPNPVEALLHGLGAWGLRLLLVTLGVRPLAVGWRWPRVMRLRRMLGLWAFTYLVLHFLTWLVLDQSLDPQRVLADIAKRPYITIGFAALLMLVPLALTSTDRWMRRLGRRWHSLHRLIYAVVLLGCIHFWWQVKADWREPALYLTIYLMLMFWRWQHRVRRPSLAPALTPLRVAAGARAQGPQRG
jgi:sulfoxide reductase heme-binding subunit YedZ